MAWLPVHGIFNMHTDVSACNCPCVRVCVCRGEEGCCINTINITVKLS